MLSSKRILLIINGGIAAYKALELIRRLREKGVSVVPVMTKASKEFVTPLSVSALAGQKVYDELFDLTAEAEMGHIELSRSADLIVVVPASADFLAKMAHGRADDMASTLVLATDTEIMVAPAMNVRMWEHKATQRNMTQLKKDGVHIVGPNQGDMACGEFGFGRLAEPAEIMQAIEGYFQQGPLSGRRIVVTSGPTHEPIDPVRYIANRSSGSQGSAIAQALANLGAEVVFITGPASAELPQGVIVKQIETAKQMHDALNVALPADVVICAAAVADWRVASATDRKIKKSKSGLPELQFVENPDILASISQAGKNRPSLVIGFAAETHDVIENAIAKRARKGCDWILANDVSPQTGIMGGQHNQVTLISEDDTEQWPRMSKHEVAHKLAAKIAETLATS